jgi:dihydrofolate synthase/folylpolyglutamate synthase
MKTFNYPNKLKNFIHIAGSKGKGSTANLVSNGLSEHKVGLFTSPHMHSIRERIKINNKPISKKTFNKYFDLIWPVAIKMRTEKFNEPTFFEFITLMALLVFRNEKVDVSVIEVGLGGRLDSTNVIDPLVTVITPISLDHTNILGRRIKDIAKEKAGIIKPNVPVIISPQTKSALFIIKSFAIQQNSYLVSTNNVSIKSRNVTREDKVYQSITFNKKYKFNLNLLGQHQIDNLKTAIKTIETYKKTIKEIPNWSLITQNITKTTMVGRCEIFKSKNNFMVIDGAQNNKSSKALLKTLREFKIDLSKIIWIFGSTQGHNAIETLKPIIKINSRIILTKSRIPKAKKTSLLFNEIKKLKLDIIKITENSKIAYDYARKTIRKDEVIGVFGSLYVAAEIMELVNNIEPELYKYG